MIDRNSVNAHLSAARLHKGRGAAQYSMTIDETIAMLEKLETLMYLSTRCDYFPADGEHVIPSITPAIRDAHAKHPHGRFGMSNANLLHIMNTLDELLAEKRAATACVVCLGRGSYMSEVGMEACRRCSGTGKE